MITATKQQDALCVLLMSFDHIDQKSENVIYFLSSIALNLQRYICDLVGVYSLLQTVEC